MDKMKRLKMNLEVKRRALDMARGAGKKGCHIGGSFSCLEIMTALYGGVLKYDPLNPKWVERDRFIASKAHCILTHFSALSYVGFINKSDLASFSIDGGLLAGHPMNIDLGLEYSAGSLGMGLSIGIGMAIDAKEKRRNNSVYILLGDGECHEGSVWEAFMAAPNFKLYNLTAIIDCNQLSYDGVLEKIMDLGSLETKLLAFGWNVDIVDGHDIEKLVEVLNYKNSSKPHAVIAKTVKANGILGLEGRPESHHAVLTEKMYEQAISGLEAAESCLK